MSDAPDTKELVIRSTRFGEIQVRSDRVITVLGGIIGFPKEKYFVLLDYNPPFSWLHSTENPDLAFVVVNSAEFGSAYTDIIPTVDSELGLNSADDLSIMNVVTFRSDPGDATVNLKAPIIVNVQSLVGRQIILDHAELSTRTPLFARE